MASVATSQGCLYASQQLGCRSSDWCSGVPLAPGQTCWPLNVERPGATVCAQGPPKKGRGLDARKAAAAGLQSRIKGREESSEGWAQVSMAEEFTEGKNKAIIHNNQGYVLVRRDTALFCIEANCTACKFPMIQGKVSESENGAVGLECPLCHTNFGLADGEVSKYVPKDGVLQWLVGSLKAKAPKQNAKVFPARISNSGRVYVKFV